MAEPTTYMGYQSPENIIDWAGLSDKFSTKLKDVEEKRQLERDTLDKMALDNTVLVSSYVPGKDQTLNEMVLRGIDDAKAKIANWNKDLKSGNLRPSEYKTRMNNIKEYWGVMANNAKNYDQRMADVITRQQEGISGAMEAELLKQWEDSTDVKSNAIVVGDDGRVYTSKFDKTTGQPTGQVTDMRLMSAPENIMANKVDLVTEIDNYTADWQPTTMFAKEGDIDITSDSVKNQPNYILMKDKVANAIAPDTNPRAQVSVLADNGLMDVEFYYNDDEYTQKYNEIFAQLEADKAILGEEITQEDLDNIDKSLIRMGIDENNMMNPILTDDQKQAVRDYISEQIDIRTEDKISRDIGLEYKIGMQNKKQTLAEQRAANAAAAAKRKASSSGKSSSTKYKEEYLSLLKDAWDNQDWRTINRSLKGGTSGEAKIGQFSDGTFAVKLKGEAAINWGAASGQDISNTESWTDVPIKDFAELSDFIDSSKADEKIIAIKLQEGELDK
jgi:hypothetical protein